MEHGHGQEKVVNYHVYKDDDHHGHYHHPSSSSIGDDITYSGWDDRKDLLSLTPMQRLRLIQLYNQYGVNGLSRI